MRNERNRYFTMPQDRTDQMSLPSSSSFSSRGSTVRSVGSWLRIPSHRFCMLENWSASARRAMHVPTTTRGHGSVSRQNIIFFPERLDPSGSSAAQLSFFFLNSSALRNAVSSWLCCSREREQNRRAFYAIPTREVQRSVIASARALLDKARYF